MTNLPTGASRTLRSLLAISLMLLIGMTAYESLKQLFFPGIAIWTSHLMTIFFSTAVGTTAGFFALRAHDRYQLQAVRDFAERRNAEEKLRRSEERFRSLIDNSEEVIGLLDINGQWIYASSSVSRLWGYSVAEMLAPRELASLVHPDDRDEVKARFRILAESSLVPMQFEFRAAAKDGSWRLLHASVVNRLEDPTVGAIVANFREVTEHRKAEDALRSSEAKLRNLFEQSLVGIYSSTPEGKLLECNEAFARMFGYSSLAEISSEHTVRLYQRPEDRKTMIALLKERGQVRDFELPFRHRNGETIWVFGSATLVESAHGHGKIIAGMLVDITARRKAEQAVRESQIVLERAQDMARVGSWRWDMTQTPPRLEWSKHLYRLLGLTQDDPRPAEELFFELTHPDDRSILIERRAAMLANRPVEETIRLRLRHADGGYRWFRTRGQSQFDGNGRTVEVIGVAQDISDQVEAEELIRASSQFSEQIISSAGEGIIVFDTDLKYVVFNPFMEELTGRRAADVLGKRAEDVLAAEIRDPIVDCLSLALKGERVVTPDLFAPSFRAGRGAWISATHTPLRAAGGEILSVIATVRDVTERKESEQAVRESQLVLERAQDVARVGSWRWDMTKTPPRLEWSKHLYRLVGLPDDDARPTDELFTALTHPDDRKLLTDRRDAMFDGGPAEEAFRIRLRHAAGGYRWFRTRGQPQFDSEGRLTEIIGAAQDISDQVEAQELIRKSETMLALGKLVAGVAHEVRNPLFAISGTIDAFEADFGDRSEFREYAEVLRREIERLTILMRDLLEYGRPVLEEPLPGSIGPVIQRAVAVCSPLAKDRQAKIVVESSEDFPEIPMDSKRLIQVFQNLIQNALQHSPKGGVVVVRISRERTDADDLICSVEDSGPGIREQELESVFEPFFTRRQGGTGLGLSIVERIVEAHRGRVAAANRPEGGAILTVRLPVA